MADKSLISAYLMNGADQLKREFLVKRLTSRIQAYGDLDFNKDSFVGPSASAEQVITACNTMPFMSEYRMVVVSDVDKAPKDVAEALVAYLANAMARDADFENRCARRMADYPLETAAAMYLDCMGGSC